MNVLIAADSFKDALPAAEVCRAIEAGIQNAQSSAQTKRCPMADGGEGTFEVLADALGLREIKTLAYGPLFRQRPTAYGLSADGSLGFIELAKTAGLQLLSPEERNPLLTSTFGVGQQIADAIQLGAKRIVLAIGGSATNDAGIGMAAALGWRFLDENHMTLSPIGENLVKIRTIVPPPNRPKASVQVICDVTNPLFGPTGAAHVYARQKGGNEAAIEILEKGLQNFSTVAQQSGKAPDPMMPGAGAAGGMGYGAAYFLNATLRRGIELVMDLLEFDKKLAWADLVFTGEGKIDSQTTQGKLVQGICRRAVRLGKPVIALCGRLEADAKEIQEIGLYAAYSINEGAENQDLANLLKNTARNLQKTAQRVFSDYIGGTT